MQIDEAEFVQLPAAEQLFIAINLERIGRGLPPIMYMTSQLNAYAAKGAALAGDPAVPTVLSGGVPLLTGDAIWAGEVSSPSPPTTTGCTSTVPARTRTSPACAASSAGFTATPSCAQYPEL